MPSRATEKIPSDFDFDFDQQAEPTHYSPPRSSSSDFNQDVPKTRPSYLRDSDTNPPPRRCRAREPAHRDPVSRAPQSLSEARSSPELPLSPQLPWSRHIGSIVAGSPRHYDEAQMAMAAEANAARLSHIKDELALIEGKITPGVDDTPYIQSALEALGRDSSGPGEHHVPVNWGPDTQHRQTLRADPDNHARDNVSQPAVAPAYGGTRHPRTAMSTTNADDPTPRPDAALRESTSLAAPEREPPKQQSQWLAVDSNALQAIDPRGRAYPPLTFKPGILRPLSMALMIVCCLLMIAALIFSTQFSKHHAGLTPYPGSIYSGQYFVFRILPQLIAVIILIYAQNILTASLRILPFAALAKEDPRERYLALFRVLYPKSFLRPQLVGPWQVVVFDLATWLAVLTVPLQSAAFTCIYVKGRWIWAPSQAVAWTLVALYALLAVSTVILMVFWLGQWTGLRRDVRCIADFINLLNRSNTTHSYARQAVPWPAGDFKTALRDRWFDRLGYWREEDTQSGGIWHTIGTSAVSQRRDEDVPHGTDRAKRGSYELSIESRDMTAFGATAKVYLPWCLRDGPLIAFIIVTGTLLVALLIVSFLPQTRLDAGFVPQLAAKPDGAAFSAANFVFSFIPALLGTVLWLLFQSLDRSLRVLQPWAGLTKSDGATARTSILADYAACLPLQSTWRALGNGHWRTAVTSFMAVLFVFIPILAGGLLMALTTPKGQVRMYPSMPVFGALIAFLLLYVGCLVLLVPNRRQFSLPRSIDCIAALASLCSADELMQDAAFRAVRSRRDLVLRLGAGTHDARDESAWFLGLSPGRGDNQLSVRRLQRYADDEAKA